MQGSGTRHKMWPGTELQKPKCTPTLALRLPEPAVAQVQRKGFLNSYEQAPRNVMSLEQFEKCAVDRLRVLQGIEDAQAKGVQQKDMQEYIEKLLRQYMPEPRSAAEVEEARARDNASHFILRLAHSRTETLRKWFMRLEEVLFRYRFNAADGDARRASMHGLQPIGQAEFERIAAELRAVFCWRDVGPEAHLPDKDKQSAEYFKDAAEPWTHVYKVPFEQVADLVRYRKVFMRGGEAYVLSSDAASLAATGFRARLVRGLRMCFQHFEQKMHEEDERLAPLLLCLPEREADESCAAGKRLTLQELPAAMQASAPLCMRRSYGILVQTHHLKYAGRVQFNLFLKAVGVNLDDALAFWRREFMKGGKTADDFDKQYKYNVRHQYGQEGCRANYAGHSCGRVISASHDRTGQSGCPFRACSSKELSAMLRGMKVPAGAIAAVVNKAQNHHYQMACSAVYKALHVKELEQPLTHPQQYFLKSQESFISETEPLNIEGLQSALPPPHAAFV